MPVSRLLLTFNDIPIEILSVHIRSEAFYQDLLHIRLCPTMLISQYISDDYIQCLSEIILPLTLNK